MQNHLIKNTSKNGGGRAPIEERSSSLFPWMIKASIAHHNITLIAKPSLCHKGTNEQASRNKYYAEPNKQTITIHQPRQNLGEKERGKNKTENPPPTCVVDVACLGRAGAVAVRPRRRGRRPEARPAEAPRDGGPAPAPALLLPGTHLPTAVNGLQRPLHAHPHGQLAADGPVRLSLPRSLSCVRCFSRPPSHSPVPSKSPVGALPGASSR